MSNAERQRYIAIQRAKIHTQQNFIHLLESQGEDPETIQMEKDILGSMMRTLHSALSHIRSSLKKAS